MTKKGISLMKSNTEQRCDAKASIAANFTSEPVGDLLESVKYTRAIAGDGLEDEEFTFFLLEKHLPAEAGFRFLCFHDGFVTLSVPSQNDQLWRSAERWIAPEKERIATHLAKKYGLILTEPPDAARRWIVPNGAAIRHHIELSNRRDTVVIAHPEFLKVRLYASDTCLVFPPVSGLLKDLAALYEPAILPDLAASFQMSCI